MNHTWWLPGLIFKTTKSVKVLFMIVNSRMITVDYYFHKTDFELLWGNYLGAVNWRYVRRTLIILTPQNWEILTISKDYYCLCTFEGSFSILNPMQRIWFDREMANIISRVWPALWNTERQNIKQNISNFRARGIFFNERN